MKKIINVFVLIFVLFNSSLFASEKIIIGVPEEWSENLDAIKNLLKESYSEIGYEVIFQELPLTRSMIEITNGRLDGELARAKNTALENNLILVNPAYFTVKGYAYYLKNKFKDPPTLNQIMAGRIGYMRGAYTIENYYKKAKYFIVVNSETQLLSLLIKDRIDFATPVTLSFTKGNTQLQKVLLFEVPLHHVLSQKNKEIAKKLEPVLKKNMAKNKNLNNQFIKLFRTELF